MSRTYNPRIPAAERSQGPTPLAKAGGEASRWSAVPKGATLPTKLGATGEPSP